MVRQMLSLAALVTMAIAAPAIAQQSPPVSAQATQTQALVEKAAALVDKEGKAAFSEFRKKDSVALWHDSDLRFAGASGIILLSSES